MMIKRKNYLLKFKLLIELLEKTVYKNTAVASYWMINMPHSECEESIPDLLDKEREHHGKQKYSKYIQMYFNNDIKSLDDIAETLLNTYEKENNGFKLLLPLGYVTEKLKENEMYAIKLYKPGQQHFHKNPKIKKNKSDIKNVIENINPEKILHKLSKRFKDSKTKLVGICSMAVKVMPLHKPLPGIFI